MAYKFKGKDRRIISRLWKTLVAVCNRDTLALDTAKKTTQLSTRQLILDNVTTSGGLRYAAYQLITQLRLDYFLPAAPPASPPPQPIPFGD